MTTYQTTDEKFAAFLAEIDRLAVKQEWTPASESYVGWTGEECWREMFDDGMTPDGAWSEELEAAGSMVG